MDARQVYVVDVFATAPLSGRPVAVLPDGGDLSVEQLGAVTRELGVEAAVGLSPAEESVRAATVADGGAGRHAAAIGVAGALVDRDRIDPGTYDLATGDGRESVEVAADGRIWVDVEAPATSPADVPLGEVAEALGIDVAALEDVGADLPPARTGAREGTLLVPVNFLEHLGALDPEPGTLATVLDAADAARIYAFTFDAVDRDATAHARVVDPALPGSIGEVDPLGTVGAVAHVDDHGAVADREIHRIEAGYYEDRPADLFVDRERDRLGGRAVTSLEGSIVVPDADEDEILEA